MFVAIVLLFLTDINDNEISGLKKRANRDKKNLNI